MPRKDFRAVQDLDRARVPTPSEEHGEGAWECPRWELDLLTNLEMRIALFAVTFWALSASAEIAIDLSGRASSRILKEDLSLSGRSGEEMRVELEHWVQNHRRVLGIGANAGLNLQFQKQNSDAWGTSIRFQQVVPNPKGWMTGSRSQVTPLQGAEILFLLDSSNRVVRINSSLVPPPKLPEIIDLAVTEAPLEQVVKLYREILNYRMRHLKEFAKKKGAKGPLLVAKRLETYARLLALSDSELMVEMSRPQTPMGRLLIEAFQNQTTRLMEFFNKKNQLQWIVARQPKSRSWNFTWRINFPFHIPIQVDFSFVNGTRLELTRVVSLEHRVQLSLFTPDDTFPIEPGKLIWEGDHLDINLQSSTEAHLRAGQTLARVVEFFKAKWNWNSVDGQGAPVEATLQIEDEPFVENAAWATAPFSRFFFGAGTSRLRGFEAAADVVAHEFTHAVVENTSALDHVGQSSAINEHAADWFGVFAESEIQKKPVDYLIGDSVVTEELRKGILVTEKRVVSAIRDLKDPSLSLEPQPTHWSKVPSELQKDCIPLPENDNCGAHLLNGLLNKAISLSAEKFPIHDIADLIFHVVTQRLRTESDFSDYVRQIQAACYEKHGRQSVFCKSLGASFRAVGL